MKTLNPRSRIQQTKQRLFDLYQYVQQALIDLDPEEAVEALVIEREEAAQTCLTSINLRKDAIRRWLAISFLLSRYPWKGKGTPESSSIESLIACSAEILERENEIFRLNRNLAQIIVYNGKEIIVSTEFDVLSHIPNDVMKQYQQSLSFEVIGNEHGLLRNLEFEGIKETMIQPRLPIVIGEELYRELKSIYQPRILPLISPSNTNSFIDISLELAGLLAFVLGNEFADKQGLMKTDLKMLTQFKSWLVDDFGKQNVESYFEHFGIPRTAHPLGLGSTVIISTRNGAVFLPYFSIFLLVYLCLRWEKNPEKGKFSRYIGKSAEDIVFSFIKAYALNTEHPLNKSPLIRVSNPEKKNEEIADVMAYNSQYLVVVESKFREALRLVDLDFELTKFSKNLDYIKNNLTKFGFRDALKIIPYLYMPFPAYSEWNGIKLVPSMLLLGIEFGNLFGIHHVELVKRSPQLQKLLLSIEGSTPYPIDGSIIDESILPDTYRVQDGVIEDYDEGEVTILIDNPIGSPTVIVVDINDEIFAELKAKAIRKGDIIKMALLNLNKAWSQIQLVEFKLVGACHLPFEELDTYGLLSVLRLNSGQQAQEKLVLQTWGEELGNEILNILKKWNIDLARFIQHQVDKGQNVLIAIGKMLGLADSYSVLVQCKCGEVMGFSSDFFKVIRTLYPDGKIQCDRCDPTQIERLRKLGYPLVRLDYSVVTRYLLEHTGKDRSDVE